MAKSIYSRASGSADKSLGFAILVSITLPSLTLLIVHVIVPVPLDLTQLILFHDLNGSILGYIRNVAVPIVFPAINCIVLLVICVLTSVRFVSINPAFKNCKLLSLHALRHKWHFHRSGNGFLRLFRKFDAVASAAEETKDPGRTIPIGIIGSLIISSILYIAVAAIMTGMVPFNLLNNASPVAFELQYVGVKWALPLSQ
jgi:amino acid transporter